MTDPTSTLRAVHERLRALCDWMEKEMLPVQSPCPDCGASMMLEGSPEIGGSRTRWMAVCACGCGYSQGLRDTKVEAWALHEEWCKEAREGDKG